MTCIGKCDWKTLEETPIKKHIKCKGCGDKWWEDKPKKKKNEEKKSQTQIP
jgi:hypothetical protein